MGEKSAWKAGLAKGRSLRCCCRGHAGKREEPAGACSNRPHGQGVRWQAKEGGVFCNGRAVRSLLIPVGDSGRGSRQPGRGWCRGSEWGRAPGLGRHVAGGGRHGWRWHRAGAALLQGRRSSTPVTLSWPRPSRHTSCRSGGRRLPACSRRRGKGPSRALRLVPPPAAPPFSSWEFHRKEWLHRRSVCVR